MISLPRRLAVAMVILVGVLALIVILTEHPCG